MTTDFPSWMPTNCAPKCANFISRKWLIPIMSWWHRWKRNFCLRALPPSSCDKAAPLLDTTARLHTRPMFSKELLDHFQNPRNAGELKDATATVDVSNPVCGDILKVAVRVDGQRIIEARFLCRGCTTSIACASRLTELLTGRQIG